MDTRAVGFEKLIDLRKLDPSLGGPEHQLNRADGTLRHALSVSDALRRVQQGRNPVDQAQDLPLRTRADARPAADAHVGIDHRVQGRRDVQLQLDRLGQLFLGAFVLSPATKQVRRQNERGQGHDRPDQVGVRRGEKLHHR